MIMPKQLSWDDFEDQVASKKGKKKIPKKKDSGFRDFGEGIGSSFLDLGYGTKDLIGHIPYLEGLKNTKEQEDWLQEWRDDAGESAWGTGGRVVGELAQMAIPGGAGMLALKIANKAKRAGKVASTVKKIYDKAPGNNLVSTVAGSKFARDTASGAAMAGLRAPGEGESRLSNAGTDAAGAAVFGLLGKVLKPVVKGFKRSDAGQRMIDKKVRPTAAQATDNPFISMAENIGAYTMGLGKATRSLREKAGNDWAKVSMDEVYPGFKVSQAGKKGFNELSEHTDKLYEKAWKNAKGLGVSDAKALSKKAMEMGEKLPSDRNAFANISGTLDEIANPTRYKPGIPKMQKGMTIPSESIAKGKKIPYKTSARPSAITDGAKHGDQTIGQQLSGEFPPKLAGRTVPPKSQSYNELSKTVSTPGEHVYDAARGTSNRTVDQALKGIMPKSDISIQQLDAVVRDEIKHAISKGARPDTLKSLQSIRKAIREEAGEGVKDSLEDIDKHYSKFLAVEKATASAHGRTYSPDQLLKGIESVSTDDQMAKGVAALQDIALDGKDVVGHKFSATPFSMKEKLYSESPGPEGLLNTFRKNTIGEGKIQGMIANLPDPLKQKILKYLSSGRLGAAIAD